MNDYEHKQFIINIEFCLLVESMDILVHNNSGFLNSQELSSFNHLSKIKHLFEEQGMYVSPIDFKKAMKLYNRLHNLEIRRLSKLRLKLKKYYYGDLPF